MENGNQGFDDKFHRCVVIIMHQDSKHRWAFGPGATSDLGTGLVVCGRFCHNLCLRKMFDRPPEIIPASVSLTDAGCSLNWHIQNFDFNTEGDKLSSLYTLII